MNSKNRSDVFCMMMVGMFFLSHAQSISITGTVKDAGGMGIHGASVRLANAGFNATTDSAGAYNIVSTANRFALLERAISTAPIIRGQSLLFALAATQIVHIRMYDLKGRLAADLVNTALTPGEYRLGLGGACLASEVFLVKAEVGPRVTVCKFTRVNRGMTSGGLVRVRDFSTLAAAKRAATVDTLIVTASGYKGAQTSIDSYSGIYDFVLQKAAFDIVYPGFNSRVFKSPGGSIIFEWNPMAGATGYAVNVDGNIVADSVPAGVTFAEVAITAFAGTTAFATHSWSVVARTAAGDQVSSTCSFTVAEAVDGTTGAPLGGMGAGAVKFCPWNGQFAFQAKTPAGQEDYVQQPNWQFSLYTKRGTTILTNAKLSAAKRTWNAANRYDDDAIFPVEYANFGATNNVSVTLTAFAPYNPADQTKMTWPVAFYHLTLRNLGSSAADAACAFQISTDQTPAVISGKGFAAEGGAPSKALFVQSSDPAAVVSVGNDAGFLASGALNNALSGTANMVAAKVTLGPGEKKDIEFVLSWCKSDDPAGYYYSNIGTSAQFFAQAGLDDFSDFESRAVQFVERFRGSNVPDWIVNTTLDQTTWSNSSIYTKDGRYSEWEGVYTWFGQMDQGWHAFGSEIWRINGPMFSWPNASQMEYWARTEMVGGDDDGQISHDFIPGAGQVTDHKTCLWDAPGYHGWGGPNWADLDCGFLFGMYESFVATGDKARMDALWPYFKRTAQRLYKMASSLNANTTYPFTFQGTGATYDKGPQDHDLYNSGLALTVFEIVAEMAGIYGDTALQNSFAKAYTAGVASFRARYLANPSASMTANQETPFAGLWMSLYFHKDQMFGDDEINNTFSYLLNNFWQPLSLGMAAAGSDGENEGWVPYILGHLGGACLTTNRVAEWRAIQRDFYNRYFENRNRVFDGGIYLVYNGPGDNFASTDWSGHSFYVSMPVVWRNYYSLIGFWFNAYTDELYVEPKLPSTTDKWGSSMNHELDNALFCVPGSYGTISYKESGSTNQNQNITVRFDKPQKVSSLYISDRFLPATTVAVTVNGATEPFSRIGSGTFDRRIKINWSGTVDSSGVQVGAVDQGFNDSTPPLAFGLVMPANGQTVQSTKPVLVWNKSSDPQSGIQRYDVYVNNSKIASTTDTAYAFTAISPGSYQWYITAVNWVNLTTSSAKWTFTYSDTIPPSPFSLVSPSDNSAVAGPAVNFYWQTASDNGTGMDHYELALDGNVVADVNADSGTASYGNLALGKTAFASSTNQGNGAANAVDGSLSTRWESSWADSQWLCVDLGAPARIDSVTLVWEAAYASSYELDVSNDTSNWTGKSVYQTTAGKGGTETIRGLNAMGRYIRIFCVKRATAWGSSLYEFQAYGLPLATYTVGTVSAGTHTWNVTAVDKAGNKRSAAKAFTVSVQ
ncbi:MAG TPA: discoidin domain-containing protein [Chitinivibrionales bacterium]|nr:discoidin domain-containing protein [Chitinivibrionales bacterium]